MSKPKILVLAGSLRKDSLNKKLAKLAAKAAEKAGAEVTHIDLADYPLPIYDGDVEAEQGLPAVALQLKALFLQSDGVIFASPEYNSSISGVLKNTIDWVSRQASPQEVYLSPFIGKTALLLSASPSFLGGLRGLVHLRSILSNIYMVVMPEQKCISNGFQAFDEQGNLINQKDFADIEQYVTKFVSMTTKLKG